MRNTPGYIVLFYQTVPGYLEKRAAYREEHLKLAALANKEGSLLFAGAFTDPADSAMFIFQGTDRQLAETFAMNDPYVKNGLITKWHVRHWNVVIET